MTPRIDIPASISQRSHALDASTRRAVTTLKSRCIPAVALAQAEQDLAQAAREIAALTREIAALQGVTANRRLAVVKKESA